MNDEFLYKSFLEELHSGVYFVDKDRKIISWNKTAEKISGFTAEEVIGSSCADNVLTHIDAEGRTLCLGLCPLAATMEDKQPREAEVFMHHKDGHRVPVSVRVCPVFDDDGNVTGGFEIFSDISNHQADKMRVLELDQFGFLDELTKLSNQESVENEIKLRLNEFKDTGINFGMIFLSIDDFNLINKKHGERIGNKVLKMVANSLKNISRPFDIYGRWGENKFAGIIRNVDYSQLMSVAEKNKLFIKNSYLILADLSKLSVTVSIGGTIAQKDDELEKIIERVDGMLISCEADGINMIKID